MPLKNSKASLGTVDDIEEGCDIFLRMDREWIYDIVVYRISEFCAIYKIVAQN